MNIKEFAEHYRVRIWRDTCGEAIVPGKDGSHIFDGYSGGVLGLCLMFATAKRWGNARRKLEASGFTIRQDGDTEGILTFEPGNEAQARLALKVAGVKARRQASPAQLLSLVKARLESSRRLRGSVRGEAIEAISATQRMA